MNWKALAFFGVLVVAGITSYAIRRLAPAEPTRSASQLNHVGISVSNFDEALEFYVNRMGYKQAFAIPDAAGQPRAVYLQVSRDTFVELLEATPDRPAGSVHVGVEVDDMNAAIGRLKGHGVKVDGPRVGRSKATVAQVDVPDKVSVELLEFGSESLQQKAIDSWGK